MVLSSIKVKIFTLFCHLRLLPLTPYLKNQNWVPNIFRIVSQIFSRLAPFIPWHLALVATCRYVYQFTDYWDSLEGGQYLPGVAIRGKKSCFHWQSTLAPRHITREQDKWNFVLGGYLGHLQCCLSVNTYGAIGRSVDVKNLVTN